MEILVILSIHLVISFILLGVHFFNGKIKYASKYGKDNKYYCTPFDIIINDIFWEISLMIWMIYALFYFIMIIEEIVNKKIGKLF